MKTKKNKIMMVVAAFMLMFAIAPTVNAESVKRTEAKKTEEMNFQLSGNLKNYGSNYTGYSVYNLKQTAATANAATLVWDVANGAAGYIVIDQSGNLLADVATNTCTINLAPNTYRVVIGVLPYDAAGNLGTDKDEFDAIFVSAVPSNKITGIKMNSAFADSYDLNVIWNDYPCDGFEAVCYSKSGKVVQTIEEETYREVVFSKTNTQNIYSVKVRPYTYIDNGEYTQPRVYGPQSKTFYAVPQPKIISKKKDIKKNSANLKWKKVKGATKYYIYASTKKNSGYKKIASVSSKKSSYKVTKYKGKTIDLTKKHYYFKIVTYAKFGKKTVKSQSNPLVEAYVYYTYY